MADLELASVPVRGAYSQSDGDFTLNTPDDVSTFKRVAHKVGGRVIRSAKQILMGLVPAPQPNVTFDKVKELAAAPADESELFAITPEIAEIHKDSFVSKCTAPSTRSVRERLHDLFTRSPVWPIGLAQLPPPGHKGNAKRDNDSIATWQNLWPRRTLQPEVIDVFAAATVKPVDGG